MADHIVMLRYSKDGGRNWSNWKYRDLGEAGQYDKRQRFKGLGTMRRVVFEIAVSSSRSRDLLGAVVNLEQTDR